MTNNNESQNESKTTDNELVYALKDVDLLLAYIAKTGKKVPNELVANLVEFKHLGESDSWSPEHEAKFWVTLNKVTTLIQPVTIASLKAFANKLDYAYGNHNDDKKGLLRKTLLGYGAFAFLVIFSIVSLQLYDLVGNDTLSKSRELFDQRNELRQEINQKRSAAKSYAIQEQRISEDDVESILRADEEYTALVEQESILDQEFDANRTLLRKWNLIWRFKLKDEPKPELSDYDTHRYELAVSHAQSHLDAVLKKQKESDQDYQQELLDAQNVLDHAVEQKVLHEDRDIYFRSRLSATYVLELLQFYILPLLYGCLGALSMVLRSLCKAIKEETFTSSLTLDYNMRIVLGSVSGMASGLFFGDGGILGAEGGSFSLMMIAFVIGYNVNVLFSMVDNVANRMVPNKDGEEAGTLSKEGN